MIARLQQFYGGDPRGWTRLPLALLQAYMANMPILRAETSLLHVSELAIGTGSAKKEDSRHQISAWRRAATKRGSVVKPTPEERVELMRAAGFHIG